MATRLIPTATSTASPGDSPGGDVTTLLHRWRHGDRRALRELFPVVYGELRRIAEGAMHRERGDHTLEATALVHEAFVRLASGQAPTLEDRSHFFALAARLMRRILVDHARGLHAERRGGSLVKVPLDEADQLVGESGQVDLLALDEALSALAAVDKRKARVIELRFFGGLDVDETARLLAVSVPTVVADTRFAKAWLYARLAQGGEA